jgi:hypothetical protein
MDQPIGGQRDLALDLCMIKSLAFSLVFVTATPVWACNPELFARLDTPLRDEADMALDVAEIASTEGGEWRIWTPGKSGEGEVARIDYGEMGRTETRLLKQSDDAFAITQTVHRYGVPIYVEGSMTVRVETDIYMFCDGALLVPPEDFGADPDYVARAEAARAVFRAEEVADAVPAGL